MPRPGPKPKTTPYGRLRGGVVFSAEELAELTAELIGVLGMRVEDAGALTGYSKRKMLGILSGEEPIPEGAVRLRLVLEKMGVKTEPLYRVVSPLNIRRRLPKKNRLLRTIKPKTGTSPQPEQTHETQ